MDKTNEILARELPGLGVKSFKLLALYSYLDGVSTSSYINRIALNLGFTGSSIVTTINELMELGYIRPNGDINPEHYFKIVFTLKRYFQKTEAKITSLKTLQSGLAAYLWDVASCFYDRDFEKACMLKRPKTDIRYNFRMERYIAAVVMEEGMSKSTDVLPDDEYRRLFSLILTEALRKDRITEDLLARLKSLLDTSYRLAADSYIQDQINAYRYFSFGAASGTRNFTPHGEPTMWSLACNGISCMFDGDLFNARQQFALALHEVTQGKDFSDSKCFSDPILNFYYGLCLYKSVSSPEGARVKSFSKALDDFKHSGEYKFNVANTPISLFLTYVESSANTANLVKCEIREWQSKDRSPYCCIMSNLLANYFDTVDGTVENEAYQYLGWVPSTAILRYELSPYLPISNTEKDELANIFGGKPVLNSVKRKERWEMMLQEIRTNIISARDEEKRIAYFMDGVRLNQIAEQNLMPDGMWITAVTDDRDGFISGNMFLSNPVDQNVLNALKYKEKDYSDAEVILPILSGTDRVFTGSPSNPAPVPVFVEVIRPYIEFKALGTKIEVISNISDPVRGRSLKKCYILGVHDSKYTMLSLSSLQHEFLSRILSIKYFPVTAVHQIKALAEKINDIVDVIMDLGVAEDIIQIKGKDTIIVRITPDNNEYAILLQACPVRDCNMRFIPGEGDTEIFDDTGGKARLITRDLMAEYTTYRILKKEIESYGVTFDDYQNVTISDPESLLKLLTFAHDNECFIIEWPEGQRLKFRGLLKPESIDIQVVSNVNWFNIEGKVTIAPGSYMSIADLLKQYGSDKETEYIQVGDNEFMAMSKELKKHLAQLEALTSGSGYPGKSLGVPAYRVGQLAKILGTDGGLHATMDDGFNRLLARMEAAYSMNPQLPEGLNAELRPYQKEGYDWLVRLSIWGAGACLADDMGLGKTLQSIAFLLSRKNLGASLVVAPKSVVPNWKSECCSFAPSLNPIVLNDEKDKGATLSKVSSGDIVITTYGMLVTQIDKLKKIHWNVVCLDEAHQIKNRNTRCSMAAMNIHADSRIVLTGTPIQNHLGEMWNLFQFINPGLLGPWQEFHDKYIRNDNNDSIVQDNLKAIISPFILRRTKDDVLQDLPDKIYSTELVELSEEEMAVYEIARNKAQEMFSGQKGKKSLSRKKGPANISFFATLTDLRLIANSVSLVYPEWKGQSSKIIALVDILKKITPLPWNRIIIFSQFVSFLEQVKLRLDKEGTEYQYLDGQTSLTERESLVKRFQNGECQTFLVSLKAGGLGLNLTAANYVILLDPWWNPSIEDQATDRAYRIGQKRNVNVIRLISARTIEEKILRLHETKRDLADRMLTGTAESSHLTMDEILELVSPYR